ncbi:ubiquitin carboxyl-terminal hydrolase 15-like [Montipora capricornis]|uniref:ubiquitin carboxyl-terminal hydrolase 15-like n=1 Tax=Montipora foliosa TaxID=591990 RepID=UPI0035F1BD89
MSVASAGKNSDKSAPNEQLLDNLEIQKKELTEGIQKPLRKGDAWYLVDCRWFKQWKKFLGFDTCSRDQFGVGDHLNHPGPIDNSSLLADDGITLKEHLIDGLDYNLLPEDTWFKLVSWYGVTSGQQSIKRKVTEAGMFAKSLKVEVYSMELKLSRHSAPQTLVTRQFSKADTVGHVMSEMKKVFGIPEDTETRVKGSNHMSNAFEPLSNMEQTVREAGLYAGQVLVIEEKDKNGSWPRHSWKRMKELDDSAFLYRRSSRFHHLPDVFRQKLREKEECLANYRAQLEERNLRETSLIQQLEEKEKEMEEQIREKEDEKANSERQLREMAQSFEERIRENEEEKTNLETQLGMKNQELNELETSLSAAQQMIIELRRQECCDWVISRGEIQVKDKCLGKGAWGSVNEATYCGCKVAVKQIHELILSAHNRRLFEREMKIASRCRHPCLLQFIGATNDEGSPLFVTELMELSLRALLEQRQLTETEISVISLDVSRALNYLHHMKPSPIVHRDISSANVLLWRQGEQWRGKVSDYGTAKFVQQTMTVAPGALIYSAPEALSSNQTSKVDVYSFGVLLCEMCIGEMPDPERREEQVLLVRNRLFRNLVRQCLQADPAMRPGMAQIIQELELIG